LKKRTLPKNLPANLYISSEETVVVPGEIGGDVDNIVDGVEVGGEIGTL